MCSQGIGLHRSGVPSASAASSLLIWPICCNMDSPSAASPASPAAAAAGEEPPRAKFLCSFGGSILPRPLDGRLRYVGGETRIVSVPRDLSFEDLLARMRELFEGASVIKYQQPDEDLDALVSVVNDDDVVNMMEEYDKLGTAGDGFTRLRIFLFSQNPEPDQSAAAHFDADERETEKRYVDALNSLADTKSPSPPDVSEQFFGHSLNVPHPSMGQRYGEVEAPWSPAYFSPGHHDPREFPPSPSSARYHLGTGELNDRISEDFVRQSAQFDHQSPPFVENMVWLPPGAVVQEKAGFPSNLGHSHNVFEGNSICEHCRMGFQRSQAPISDPRYVDPRWKHGQPHIEQPSTGSEYMGHYSNSCAECYRSREAYMVNESHGHDHGWVLHHHQGNHRLEDPRIHIPGTGRVGEHYVVEGNVMNVPFGHANFYDGHSVPSEVFHGQQTVGGVPHAHIPGFEDTAVRYGNPPSQYGDNLFQVPHNLPPIQSLRRKVHVPVRPGTSYESPGVAVPNGGIGPGFIRSTPDGSPRVSRIGVDDQVQNNWAVQNGNLSQILLGIDGSAAPEYQYEHSSRLNSNVLGQDGRLSFTPDPVQCHPATLHVEIPSEVASNASGYPHLTRMGAEMAPGATVAEGKKELMDLDSKGLNLTAEELTAKVGDSDANIATEHGANSVECLSYLPELIASVKKAVLESAEEAKAKAEENPDTDISSVPDKKESSFHEIEAATHGELECESDGDGDNTKVSKIEPTTAEAEALAKGLQTIRNDDLEEIRELGSGTYGSVYHGKWKGSDVAIKRIKASCFAGKPSERERLIADFWKEALILSSLHHPNVVSFYGVVRDGPDGSLATVTEFMVNGSLKQFLQKKDRTIDRRKRLIIAMDAAFGMEYLHGKNIVHFDLKCENLLVNMRDPQRPICKIGDLGLSKVKQHTLVSGGVRGTLPWMAPELLSGKSSMVTEKIDVYSFGIVMWELLTGEEPYADMRCASIIGGIVNNSLRPQIPTWCDPEWKSLMESCWSADPGERPSFSEISQKLRKMSAAINVK